MQGLTSQIKDSFEIISLILVFLFVLFDLKYPKIQEVLQLEKPPPVRIQDLRHFQKKHRQVIWRDVFPLFLGYFFLVYLFLPLFISVLSQTHLVFWHFDFLITAFIVVVLILICFLGWITIMLICLSIRLQNSKKVD